MKTGNQALKEQLCSVGYRDCSRGAAIGVSLSSSSCCRGRLKDTLQSLKLPFAMQHFRKKIPNGPTRYYNGMSSIISVAPSRPTVKMTSPNVFVLKPASQYVK